MPDTTASTLLQSALAALGPSQSNRLIRLHTPLGDDVLLAARMQGEEAISPYQSKTGQRINGFRLEILALSTNAHLQLKDLIGQPVRLDLLTQQSRTELRPFHGHVTAFRLVGSDNGLATYHIVIEPFLHFLGHRQDAWVFQDQSVIDIVDEVLRDHQGQGALAPAWRWDLADPSVYPRRSLCMQYEESDLAFIERLLLEEGLFYYFEHSADGGTLGQHTLVISDHNGAFTPNVQPQVRFTQSGAASFKADSLTRFCAHASLTSSQLNVASWDYRGVYQPSSSALGANDTHATPAGLQLVLRQQPGVYAFENNAQAQRIAQRQLEALHAVASQYQAEGPLRSAACGTTFSLQEHPQVSAATQLVTVRVAHRARSNLTTAQQTALDELVGTVSEAFRVAPAKPAKAPSRPRATRPSLFDSASAGSTPANATEEPLYQARLIVQDATSAVRAPGSLRHPTQTAYPRPLIQGEHTALVVGLNAPVHTDRDGRIKIQFHWQRGEQSAHRLSHSAGSNAPASDASGTWVRASQAMAGKNFGANFIPRLGQEVKVSFLGGDPDRPVVTGSVYNGRGQPDAQGNQVSAGAARATGNAGAWFPGNRRAGDHEGHAHTAVLTGIKTQALSSSQSGGGGYNQLVFDDSPQQARTLLGTTQAATWLSLGHLIHQNDNQRLAKRGHGLELITAAQGALRAGSGLYLSTHAPGNGSASNVQPSDARPAIQQIQQAQQRSQALIHTAQQHHAKLKGEPEPKELAVTKNQASLIESQQATDGRGGQSGQSGTERDAIRAIEGGHGTVAAPSRPDLMVYGDGGIAIGTPAHSVFVAGTTASLVAGQDINLVSQRHTAVIVDKGVSLFTYGKASQPTKPNTETGIQLHAASGNVHVQASDNSLHMTADKKVAFSSVTSRITMGAPKHILLTAGGSAIRLTNGSITLTTPGMATFKAAMKELTGPSGGSTALKMPTSKYEGCPEKLADAAGFGGQFV